MKEILLTAKVIKGELAITLSGGTYEQKEEIKALGYYWDSFSNEWVKKITPDQFKEVVGEAITTFGLTKKNLSASKEAQHLLK